MGAYAGAMGLDAGTIGALLGLQTLMFATGAPLVGGRLGDRFGRRLVFSLSLVLYALGIALLLLVFTLVATVIGLFWVPRLPTAETLEQPPVGHEQPGKVTA